MKANFFALYLSTQIRLIQSDSVLRPVAEKYHLIEHNGKRRYASPEEAALATDGRSRYQA
jgi:uncharacterized protein involved in exopolysaccharide biosynthesis